MKTIVFGVWWASAVCVIASLSPSGAPRSSTHSVSRLGWQVIQVDSIGELKRAEKMLQHHPAEVKSTLDAYGEQGEDEGSFLQRRTPDDIHTDAESAAHQLTAVVTNSSNILLDFDLRTVSKRIGATWNAIPSYTYSAWGFVVVLGVSYYHCGWCCAGQDESLEESCNSQPDCTDATPRQQRFCCHDLAGCLFHIAIACFSVWMLQALHKIYRVGVMSAQQCAIYTLGPVLIYLSFPVISNYFRLKYEVNRLAEANEGFERNIANLASNVSRVKQIEEALGVIDTQFGEDVTRLDEELERLSAITSMKVNVNITALLRHYFDLDGDRRIDVHGPEFEEALELVEQLVSHLYPCAGERLECLTKVIQQESKAVRCAFLADAIETVLQPQLTVDCVGAEVSKLLLEEGTRRTRAATYAPAVSKPETTPENLHHPRSSTH